MVSRYRLATHIFRNLYLIPLVRMYKTCNVWNMFKLLKQIQSSIEVKRLESNVLINWLSYIIDVLIARIRYMYM